MQDRVDQRLVRHPLFRRARLQPREVPLRDGDGNPLPLAVQRALGGLFPEGTACLDVSNRNPLAAFSAFD
jgi:hypothetical protein